MYIKLCHQSSGKAGLSLSRSQSRDSKGILMQPTAKVMEDSVSALSSALLMQVLGCNATAPISDSLAGLDWIARNAEPPAVVILSLGVADGVFAASLEQAVRSLVQDFNITVVTAAGGSGFAQDLDRKCMMLSGASGKEQKLACARQQFAAQALLAIRLLVWSISVAEAGHSPVLTNVQPHRRTFHTDRTSKSLLPSNAWFSSRQADYEECRDCL